MVRRWCLALAALAVGVATASSPAAARSVDLALVLAVDVSGSVNGERFELQRRGYAKAIVSPEVLQAIAAGQNHAILVTLVEWSGVGHQQQTVGWTLIDGRPRPPPSVAPWPRRRAPSPTGPRSAPRSTIAPRCSPRSTLMPRARSSTFPATASTTTAATSPPRARTHYAPASPSTACRSSGTIPISMPITARRSSAGPAPSPRRRMISPISTTRCWASW